MDIDKETKDLIEKILHEIAEDIIERFDKKELKEDIGLLSGKAGISLFMFYNARYFKSEKYEEYAQKILEDVFNDINNGNLIPTYCSGLAGVCWTVNHLVEEKFIDKDNLQVLDEFDEYLYKAMQGYIERNDFDFLHGATGIAFYFTKRADKDKNFVEYLKYYVQKLKDYAIFDEEEKTAKIISIRLDENNNTNQVYNLSMSHGMSSIIIILCKIHDLMEDKSDCLELIEGMTNYIISHRNFNETNNNSLYPSAVCVDGSVDKKSKTSRLGWCYGDIGNGIAFYNSSELINENTLMYKSKANEIFLNLFNRQDPVIQSINDTGLCHGSSGLVCVFRSLLYNNFDKKYEKLHNYWLDLTLNYFKRKDLEGFFRYVDNSYVYESSFLNGITGVGMTLVEAVSMSQVSFREILLI